MANTHRFGYLTPKDPSLLKRVRSIINFLTTNGVVNVHLVHGGKHSRVYYKTSDGWERFQVICLSPSPRGERNFFHDLKEVQGRPCLLYQKETTPRQI
jgi:hypothetical protein